MTNGCYQQSATEDEHVWRVEERPRILTRCFMSEKWCMSEKTINSHWESRIDSKVSPQAFVIMPYTPAMDFIYNNHIKPLLANLDHPLLPVRADAVMRTGYIICQKICMPILMADLAVAEVTSLNNNILYELGFSIGLERDILLMAEASSSQKGGSGGPDIKEVFTRSGLDAPPPECLSYDPTGCSNITSFDLQSKIWKPKPPKASEQQEPRGKIGILGTNNLLIFGNYSKGSELSSREDRRRTGRRTKRDPSTQGGGQTSVKGFKLAEALKSQLGNSLRDEICRIKGFDVEVTHEENLGKGFNTGSPQTKETERKQFLKSFQAYAGNAGHQSEENDIPFFEWMLVRSKNIDDAKKYGEIPAFIESCDYLIVDVTKPIKRMTEAEGDAAKHDQQEPSDKITEAMELFWIGYCHGRGKKVIPLYCSDSEDSAIRATFDIQGLYAFRYDITHPEKSCEELTASCQIEKALKEDARNRFWKPFFDVPQLKIFVGAIPDSKRYSLNEWDYLTLAELNRYFSEGKPTLHTEIISPIHQQPAGAVTSLMQTFDSHLQRHISEGNHMLIGSPDVNVMTELILAKALCLEPFSPDLQRQETFSGWVTQKIPPNRSLIFYNNGKKCEFKSSKKDDTEPPKESCQTFTFCDLGPDTGHSETQVSSNKEILYYHSYGLFAYLNNPCCQEKPLGKSGKIIILSGISGPATLSLAQMLTGKKNDPKPTSPPALLDASGSISFTDNIYRLKLPVKDATLNINNPTMFEKDLKELLAQYGEVEGVITSSSDIIVEFSKWNYPEGVGPTNISIVPNYEKMSLKILERVNATIAEAHDNDIVYAIIETFIEETVGGDDPCWRDQRRVIAWRLAENLDGQMEDFKNPFIITPSTSNEPSNAGEAS